MGLKIETGNSYWCQHIAIDFSTRVRMLGLVENSDNKIAVAVQERCKKNSCLRLLILTRILTWRMKEIL